MIISIAIGAAIFLICCFIGCAAWLFARSLDLCKQELEP